MRRQYGVVIVRHGERRESHAHSGRESQPNSNWRRARQCPSDFGHTEADRLADMRALLRWSPGGGLFHDARDCFAVAERIFHEILSAVRDEQLWRGHVVQGAGRTQ